MVQEAVLRDRLADPIDFTVADGTSITKGALLQLTDPRTASALTASTQKIAGIAARDKVASDGRTRLAVYRHGIFDMYCSGAVTLGAAVSGTDTNAVKMSAPGGSLSGAAILGHALETGTDGEVIQIYVDVGASGALG